jgi:outer membrane immunogenic protein
LEAGYNWQPNNFVFGFEADIESFSLRGNSSSGFVVYPGLGGTGFIVNSNAETTWLATARERVGLAVDNWLFFATAGASFTTLKANFTFNDDNSPFFAAEVGSISSTRVGYAAGGGVEAGLWRDWSIKAEYLYVDFGTVSVNSNTLTTTIVPFPTNVFTHSMAQSKISFSSSFLGAVLGAPVAVPNLLV